MHTLCSAENKQYIIRVLDIYSNIYKKMGFLTISVQCFPALWRLANLPGRDIVLSLDFHSAKCEDGDPWRRKNGTEVLGRLRKIKVVMQCHVCHRAGESSRELHIIHPL